MVGAGQPEDLRCSCKTKFAEVTEKAITIGCRGCVQPLILPFAVLAGGKASIMEYLSKLPPRRKRFGAGRKKPPQS
jgi:hypothetical protein